jgi:hypothetical protein
VFSVVEKVGLRNKCDHDPLASCGRFQAVRPAGR